MYVDLLCENLVWKTQQDKTVSKKKEYNQCISPPYYGTSGAYECLITSLKHCQGNNVGQKFDERKRVQSM